MLPTVDETIDALTAEVRALLSAPADPALIPDVTVSAGRSHPVGLGGFVGIHPEPKAELHARRLDAQVVVRVRAESAADLMSAEAQAVRDIIAANPSFLRSRGMLRLERVLDGPDLVWGPPDGLDVHARELRFSVAFEHKPVPETSEGELTTAPIDITTAIIEHDDDRRYETEFVTDPFTDFAVAPNVGSLADWQHDAAEHEIRHVSDRGGGSDAPNGNKTGAYLLVRAPSIGGSLDDFVLHTELRSDGPGGIGLVFRFVDASNFGFFLMDEPGRWRIFGRRRAGSGALFELGASDTTEGFPQGEWLRLRLLAQGNRFELAINETTVMRAEESSALTAAGQVGLFARKNATARFRHLRASSL